VGHDRDPWSAEATVAGFARSPPNEVLMAFAAAELRRSGRGARTLDVGCGAGRNAVPLARAGWRVLGVDRSAPMLAAAAARHRHEGAGGDLHLAGATMDALPVAAGTFDLVVAHGIWNLARSGLEMRRAIADAARAAAPGAALFVFTFSRHTLPADAPPVAGETFVFTQFSGQPQCFLTAEELVAELAAAGFVADPAVPLRELNRPAAGTRLGGGPPVIWEGAFRRGSR
jgi:SAM-dependent methyltransferase